MEPMLDYDSDDDLDYIYKITAQEQTGYIQPWMVESHGSVKAPTY